MTTGLRVFGPPGSRVFAVMLVLSAIAGSQAAPLMAQGLGGHITEAQRPEVYAQFGALGVGSDEGHIGTGASYGGTVELPIERRLVFDLDVQTSRIVLREWDRPSDWYRTRRNLVMPGLLVRFGRERGYGFAGGGIAGEWDATTYHLELRPGDDPGRARGWSEIRPGVFELRQAEARGLKPFCKLGFGVVPVSGLSVRGEIYGVGWHLGARLGVGYRFARR